MDALVAGTLIKEDPLNLGLLVGTPGWDPHLPGSRPPGFNGAGFGSSTTGPPYGFDPSTDIRRVANSNGKVTYFSSSGLARRICKMITVRNDASKALNAAVATGASRDEIKNLQEELEYAVLQIRQCEWVRKRLLFTSRTRRRRQDHRQELQTKQAGHHQPVADWNASCTSSR